MNLIRIFVVCLFSFVVQQIKCLDIPRIAFTGPVLEYISVEDYKDMKECGFTHCINIYNTLELAKLDLQRAYKVNIGVYVHTPQIVQTPTMAAAYLKNVKGFSGYFIADEPSYADLYHIKEKINAIAKVDRKHACCINLHPYYNANQFRNIGSQTYQQYLEASANLGMPQLSFDYYPITYSGLRDGWFGNLSMVRNICRKKQKCFWGFVLTVPHGDYPKPTLATLRLQSYVNLVYGAKALVYFTYMTFYDKNYDFHDAPLDIEGKKTKTYYLVRSLNRELKSISKLFSGAVITNVGHLVKVPSGEQKAPCPQQLSRLVVAGKKGAVVSQFLCGRNKYLAVVNKDYNDSLSLSIKAKTKNIYHIKKNLSQEKIVGTYIIKPGDIELFKLN